MTTRTRNIPLDQRQLDELLHTHETPLYIYDEAGIRNSCRKLSAAFSWAKEFKNYFAVKACPNPYILSILKEEGCGADCSSVTELVLSEAVGFHGEDIMYTSNDTPVEGFRQARDAGAIINLDDISHIDDSMKKGSIPTVGCFRFAPSNNDADRQGNQIIGSPRQSKFGVPQRDIIKAYKTLRDLGVRRFGIHTMLASNELSSDYFIKTAKLLFSTIKTISHELGIEFDFVNLGGGLGIPQKPDDQDLDIELISCGIKEEHDTHITGSGLPELKIFLECGRYVTGPHGYLLSKVRHVSSKYKKFVGVDACMSNFMRPALYNAYHEITVLGKEKLPRNKTYDVTGYLCENNDKFAIDRQLPKIYRGDLIVIYDVGAHGYSMGFNYNGSLKSAEFLLTCGKNFKMIRRPENLKDHFATLTFPGNEFELSTTAENNNAQAKT